MKYAMFLGVIALGYHEHAHHGVHWAQNIGLHILLLSALRYLLFQIWGTAARLPTVSRKHQIVKKGITFEQVEHEASWENNVLLTLPMFAAAWSVFRADFAPQMRPWDARGIVLAFAMHVGPVEWLYYWAHRALHHHYLFARYHTHHHSSFVTQPITCKSSGFAYQGPLCNRKFEGNMGM
jgi:aldehyde decarbonylase